MMAIANIDFIVYDVSNGVNEKQQNFEDPNNNSYAQIMKTVEELTAEGWKVPKIAFYTHSRSSDVVRMLYNKLYKKGLYKNAWYMVNGKPFIVGYTNLKDEIEEADSRGDTSYKPTALSSEIMNFFSWREAQWPQETFRDNGFPWMERGHQRHHRRPSRRTHVLLRDPPRLDQLGSWLGSPHQEKRERQCG